MHLSRLLLLPIAALSVAACGEDDGVTVNERPPLGGVRFVNAVPDGGAVDIRMIDQVNWSASSVNLTSEVGLPFRGATAHWPTEAKARHIRVFPTSSNIDQASTILVDTTITVVENKNVTLMLVGTRAANNLRFVEIDDTAPALTGNQIAVRVANAGITGGLAAYITPTNTTALAAPAAFTVADAFGGSAYVVRDTGVFSIRAAAAGAPLTAIASTAAPAGAPADGLVAALGGYRAAGSALGAYVFPRACPAVALPLTAANCPHAVGRNAATITALSAPAVVFYVDRIPAPTIQTTPTPTTGS